jgi:hypothetical protein
LRFVKNDTSRHEDAGPAACTRRRAQGGAFSYEVRRRRLTDAARAADQTAGMFMLSVAGTAPPGAVAVPAASTTCKLR